MTRHPAFVCLIVSLLAITMFTSCSEAQQTPEPTAAPTPTTPPTPVSTDTPLPIGTATPTINEVIQEFLLCDSLLVNTYIDWGQAPGTIISDDPAVSGQLEPGDHVKLLMPSPDAERRMRVEVYPHDGRAVGKTNNRVWVSWYAFYATRLEKQYTLARTDNEGDL